MKESAFQAALIKAIKRRLPGCMIFKNDPDYLQGVPDLLILYQDRWAALECKRCAAAPRQPNQDYYVRLMDRMSFARFVFPENQQEVLDALQRSFAAGREARPPERQ